MKLFRGFLLAAGAALVVIAGAAGLAFDPAFQTWAAHRILARRPALGVSVDSVAFGLNGVVLRNVRVERRGAVLSLPYVEAELPVVPAGFNRSLRIHRLAARGWTLDLRGLARASRASGEGPPSGTKEDPAAVARRSFSFLSTASAADSAPLPAAEFMGILNQIRLPLDFAMDGLDLEGDVILPVAPGAAAGRVHVMLSGGGLAAGHEGNFSFSLTFIPTAAGEPVNSVVADGTLIAAMDGPRTFRRLALRIDAAATGPKLPRTVRLSADLGAVRGPAGETYSLTVAGHNRQLAALTAGFPDDRRRVAGAWNLDVSDRDLSPFLLGRALPVFYGNGVGRFDADVTLADVHVVGRLDLMADRLALLRPQLSGVGAVRLAAEFDFTSSGSTLRVDRLKAALTGGGPILTVLGLQAFAFNAETGELTVADSARDLFGVALQDVPLEWGQPFLRGMVLTGGSLRGNLVAGARDGGLSLRSSAPLSVAGLSAVSGGRVLLQNAGMSLAASADYSPLGWQIEIESRAAAGAAASNGGAGPAPPYRLEARIGRLANRGQPVKLTGSLSIDLPAALASPALGEPFDGSREGGQALVSGSAVCDFVASLGARRSIEAKVTVSHLAIGVRNRPLMIDSAAEAIDIQGLNPPVDKLPDITADIRADVDSADNVVFEAPLLISQDGRRSDLTVAGTAAAAPAGVTIDGQITGEKVFVNDTKILVLLGQGFGGQALLGPGAGKASPGPVPFWSGVAGRLTLALKNVVAPQFTATDIAGTVFLEPKTLKFDGLQASLGDTGDVRISGDYAFDASADDPYSLDADVSVGNFDPAPVFRARYPERPPSVEGKFSITGRISGRGANPYDAAADAHGELSFVSNGGVLRLFSMDGLSKGGSARKVAILGFVIGDLASALTGRKDLGQDLAGVVGRLSAIPYDQLSLVLSRDASLNTALKDFALISPEIRMEGGGRVAYAADTPLLRQPLAAEFKLRARGHTADVFKLVGMLDANPDDLGYCAFAEPLKIAGTLGKPDTSELQATLLKDIYNRSGASDLFDKLLGK